MTEITTTSETIKTFVLEEFLPGEDPDALQDTTALVDTGIIDSLATLKLIMFIEETFGVTIEPRESNSENLNTIQSITRLVESKR